MFILSTYSCIEESTTIEEFSESLNEWGPDSWRIETWQNATRDLDINLADLESRNEISESLASELEK